MVTIAIQQQEYINVESCWWYWYMNCVRSWHGRFLTWRRSFSYIVSTGTSAPRTPRVASNMLGTMSDAKGDVRLVKELLANAPRERAWQRRGLPVLCRAFPGRCLAEDEPEGNSSQEKAPWVVLGPVVRKRPRLKSPWNFESPVMDATSSVHDSTGGAEVSDGGGGAQQSSKGQEFGRKTARLLVGLKEDGVFRHVVEFL